MKTPHKLALVTLALALVGAALTVALAKTTPEASAAQKAAQPVPDQSTLTVVVSHLKPALLSLRVAANGNIVAWQEAIIGTEANGLRLAEVKVNVGDRVRRGQLLATFTAQTVEAELAQSRAAVAEADAALAEAAANAQRGRVLQDSGALSGQQIHQYATAERAAKARLDAARAVERTNSLRLAQARFVAPDDGIISARTATVGAVVPAGQELFRLIQGGRLEWRAEVAAADLARLKPGQKVRIAPAGGEAVEGRLRMLAPAIDILSRNGLAYVDLPPSDALRAGMFARGEFELGTSEAMTLPQGAVLLREGFSYVMRVGPDFRIVQTKVRSGRRAGDRIEITGGLDPNDRVVAAGAAFLGDGDLVRVAEGPGT